MISSTLYYWRPKTSVFFVKQKCFDCTDNLKGLRADVSAILIQIAGGNLIVSLDCWGEPRYLLFLSVLIKVKIFVEHCDSGSVIKLVSVVSECLFGIIKSDI